MTTRTASPSSGSSAGSSTTAGIAGLKFAPAPERRRRPRVSGRTIGWLMPPAEAGAVGADGVGEPWEVRVLDVSRAGVGFESGEPMKPGDACRIRIGRGPMDLARPIRVTRCEPGSPGSYRIGAVFA